MKAQRGYRIISLSFFNLVGMGWMVNVTTWSLYPRKETRYNTSCIGVWVGPKTGLDGHEKSPPYRNSMPEP